MEKYFAIIKDNQYIDIWDSSLTDNYIYARLYNSITDLKTDLGDLQGYNIKELIIDNEFNLISERLI